MKSELPERSLVIKDRLAIITAKILSVAEKQISKIILFGSYARGTWVKDKYFEGSILYSYESDLDILIVLKKEYSKDFHKSNVRDKIETLLKQQNLRSNPPITLITEPITYVNKQLEKNQYFFSDIKKEGILLYDDGVTPLAEAKNLSKNEKREIAEDDYEYWFERGEEFLFKAKNAHERKVYWSSAFELHQSTESFYNAILLVFTGYKPKLHDLEELGGMVRVYHDDLLKIFPIDTPERKECFELLRDAYVDARYNKNYIISKEQLDYLIKRVEKLKKTTEKICLEKIDL